MNKFFTTEDFAEIRDILETRHSIFYKFWEIGRPVELDTIPTACVRFDKTGSFLDFCFNPDFYKSLDMYSRAFIIAHEMLHVLLDHGFRGLDIKGGDPELLNIAMDVVVNEMLVFMAGFKRSAVKDHNKYCWMDTVFKREQDTYREAMVRAAASFEYYYDILKKNPENTSKQKLVDVHGDFGSSSTGRSKKKQQVLNDLIKEAINGCGKKDKEKLRKALNDIGKVKKPGSKNETEDEDDSSLKGTQAGTGLGDAMFSFAGISFSTKKKWETVIKKWAEKYMTHSSRDFTQWARTNRRFATIYSDLIIPTEMEVENRFEDKKRIKVVFFMDLSGSCYGYAKRFYKAVRSLPPERFKVDLYTFDTTVHAVDLTKDTHLKGGGGTSFSILESKVQEIKKRDQKHPEAVFVISDGYGNILVNEFPKKWYWFLTTNYRACIPKESNIFLLKDYE